MANTTQATEGFKTGDLVWLKNRNGSLVSTLNNSHTAHERIVFVITEVTDYRTGTRYILDTDNVFAARRHCGGFGYLGSELVTPAG